MEDGTDAGVRPPRTADELHDWIRTSLGLVVPRRALIEGSSAPFEYLVHAFFGHEVPDCIVWANRGGGKTFLGAVATALDLAFRPGVQIRILAGSLEQAGRMHTHLRTLFAMPALAGLVDGRITERRLRVRGGGGVELLAQSQASVRGTRVQKLRCDEVELFDPRIWEAAQLVTRSEQIEGETVRGSIECLSTMHRPHGLMHALVEEARAGTRRLFKWGVVDVLGACDETHACDVCDLEDECAGRAKVRDAAGSEPGHVSVDDALRLKQRVGLATWEAEMLCLRPARTNAVIPEFDARQHVVDEVPRGESWVGGMDFGYRAPTVILWGAVDAQGVLWIVDERVVAGVVLDEHVRAIRTAPYPAMDWIGVDPAGAQRNDQTGVSAIGVMKKAGLNPKSRAMRVQDGVQLIRARLKPAAGGSRLYVHRRCVKLIEALERHHYPEDEASLSPVKDGTDHAVDALRYLLCNLDRTPSVARVDSYLR